MTRYQIETSNGKYFIFRFVGTDNREYFSGYDFMGSINWTSEPEYEMDVAEAYQIIKDLESADEPMAKDEPKTMKRIEVLRALAAAHSAFRAELEKYGISMSGWVENEPYTLFIDNGPTKPLTILGEYDYKQKVSKNLH